MVSKLFELHFINGEHVMNGGTINSRASSNRETCNFKIDYLISVWTRFLTADKK